MNTTGLVKNSLNKLLQFLLPDFTTLKNNRLPSQKLRLIILAVVILSIVAYTINKHLVITLSDSVQYRVFLKTNTPPELGDYIMVSQEVFSEKDKDLLKKHGISVLLPLVKRIGCDERLELRIAKNKDYYCGDLYLGRAKEKTKKGFPLQAFVWNGPVPSGKIFLIGDNPNSYDSRYMGFIDKKYIITKLVPLI